MKTCPFCAEDIQDAAIVCKHCGRDLNAPAQAATAGAVVPPKKRSGGCATVAIIATVGLGALVVLAALFGTYSGPKTLTAAHQEAISSALKARALTQPTKLSVGIAGQIVADYELSDEYVRRLAIPLKTFAQDRLLIIREAALPFGFDSYRVNIFGTPPGTGLVRRYGAARLMAHGSLEWLVDQ